MRERRWISVEALALIRQTGLDDPVQAIESLATDLLDEMDLVAPPVYAGMAASFRGVRNLEYTLMESSARLVPHPDRLVIEVNSQHPVGRQNFSICHEISHILMPTYAGRSVEDYETGSFAGTTEEEVLCDYGAAALLLPPRWLYPLAQEFGPSLTTLQHLADLFGASLQATARQLARLDVWSCAFVMWEEGWRKSERLREGQEFLPGMEAIGGPDKKLRVAARYCAPSFTHFIPLNKSVPESSLVAACSEELPFTRGMELFDLGSVTVSLYCENYHAPYRQNGVSCRRVISLLISQVVQRRITY